MEDASAVGMHLPGPVSLAFLVVLLVLLPWAARRSARLLEGGEPARPAPTRLQYWRGAVLFQLFLLSLAWFTGSGFGFEIFAVEKVGGEDVHFAIATFLFCLGLRFLSRRVRSEAELRDLTVYSRAPRTGREKQLFFIAAMAAAVAEEAAYRGVGWSILWYSLGNPWIAALIMALAFAVLHWDQGWKSGATIVGIALLLQGLVARTGSLVPAMVVHAAYDLVVGRSIQREALRRDLQKASREA